MTIRCSIGTANVLGLKKVKADALPTTAYLMVGERCRFDCAFCAQARNSSARADLLSRVSWPKFAGQEVVKGLAFPEAQTVLQRVCFQVVQDKVALEETKQWVKVVRNHSDLPICVSAGPRTLEEVQELLDLGVDHISIALDAATAEIYAQTKDGSWVERFTLLSEAAERFPGHLATHLIVGLGENEEEMVRCLQTLYDRGITVALFAFTPVKGTRLEGIKPPEMAHYRRIQVAHDLIRQGLARVDQFHFGEGKVLDFNLSIDELQKTRGGEPFQTSGCKGCNRPYYNEKPGEELYNYPRALIRDEVEIAWGYLRTNVDQNVGRRKE
ncbi:radical SAM protein [Desulfosporosinus sp. BICA1-9]|uniref:radical SAM protein n=1 Tax=Desulfosporosinus sp. BICA1-9 TaxID=1531958 RepID=UPI00054C0CF9|nr:radical SAM protein [Desulfosporosinus sp. BICA1-9]KJS50878.1 MAG: radical SAM protein [Peptococcaceae bacterium BRH_c23]KJS79422.1 MAG: radical SAM protein [Desulfosporosinus sp. BICA1-9]HBW37429.1 radical SAM protein [Desulfosporosinus sp.]